MRNWMARLAYSFAIVAAVLWWSAYKQSQSAAPGWRIGLDVVTGAMAAGLALAGIRSRNR